MIAPEIIGKIRKLLKESGHSQRKIAKETGVSRGTVNAIALGRRRDREPRQSREGDGFTPPSGVHSRCPTCGGLVQMPCLLCQLRGQTGKSSSPTGKSKSPTGKSNPLRGGKSRHLRRDPWPR